MYKFSIVTPTYNRGSLLKILYESLQEQTFKDFEWIIIDDGSVDNTQKVVEGLIRKNEIKIIYKKTNNGGKHRAINYALNIANSELFFIVDSDDYLTKDSLEKILNIEKTIYNKKEFCGIAGLKATFNGKLLTNKPNFKIKDANSIDAFYKYKLVGDKAEVFYTNVLKRYTFPEFVGENYITESILWNKIASDGYKIRWFNEIIYLAEYREDGLTNKALELSLKNPYGKAYFHNQESSFNIPLVWKIKHQANYYRFGLWGGVSIKKLLIESKCKYVSIFAIPIGMMAIIYTKMRILKEK